MPGFPVLTPAYGLGSYGRTGMALLISSPRTKLGSQNRIYSYYNRLGKGQEYIQFLINTSGVKFLPRVNPWTAI